jgi:hypothetical protein
MFSEGIFKLLIRVVSSWQVIAITIALLLYLNIVFYVSRSYHRPREKKVRVKKKKAEEIPAATTEEGASSNDELGLEEK